MRRRYTVKETEEFAKGMRMLPTSTESKLFNALTEALSKTTARVHMQHVIGPYIADLYIPYAQLIIEADGATHAGRKKYDERRATFMRNRGYRTLRYSNIEIWQDCESVVEEILEACGELKVFEPSAVNITYCPPMWAAGHKSRLRLR
jgi:very-short-patch-repair endonuclease